MDSATPFDQLVTFGPEVFAASARLRLIPDPTAPAQAESDAEVGDDHLDELAQVRVALGVLARFTRTPDDCFVCVWEGYSDVRLPPGLTAASMVVLPHRRYALFRGPQRALDSFAADFGPPGATTVAPPAFVWPADRRWCLARDVDPHWAGLGAGRAAVEALVAEPRLDVVAAVPSAVQPHYR